jgi:hypothetical protein
MFGRELANRVICELTVREHHIECREREVEQFAIVHLDGKQRLVREQHVPAGGNRHHIAAFENRRRLGVDQLITPADARDKEPVLAEAAFDIRHSAAGPQPRED